jgi:hypothetical protein
VFGVLSSGGFGWLGFFGGGTVGKGGPLVGLPQSCVPALCLTGVVLHKGCPFGAVQVLSY